MGGEKRIASSESGIPYHPALSLFPCIVKRTGSFESVINVEDELYPVVRVNDELWSRIGIPMDTRRIVKDLFALQRGQPREDRRLDP